MLKVAYISTNPQPKVKKPTKKDRTAEWGKELINKWTLRDRKEAIKLLKTTI